MNYSYAMGSDDSILELKKYNFLIDFDGYNYLVSFPKDKANVWEEYIIKHLELGYWNEYISDNKVIFIFHLEDGIKRFEVLNYENDEVLKLCERLCECKFESIKKMLKDNHFYKDKIK